MAFRLGCDGSRMPDTSAPPIDLEKTLPGAETSLARYPGCRNNVAVELWTMRDGTHATANIPTLRYDIWKFLEAHPKR